MDEKTEQLRDIFADVTEGVDTVTESQEADRGSLDRGDMEDRLETLIDEMRERYETSLPFETHALRTVITSHFEGKSDEAIAQAVGTDVETVFRARQGLHLYTAEDWQAIEFTALREYDDPQAVSEAFDVPEEVASRCLRATEARIQSRAVNDRYRDAFADLAGDTGLSERLASDVREDGLEDATEGMETDVSF